MTVTIELSPEEERRLQERAGRLGQERTSDVRGLIRRDLEANPTGRGRTFLEILAPLHQDFRASGLDEGSLDSLLDEALRESRDRP